MSAPLFLVRVEPCACGGAITVHGSHGVVTAAAIVAAVVHHNRQTAHVLWRSRQAWAAELPGRLPDTWLDERIPTGASHPIAGLVR